jgi:hypothetical protein
MKKILRLAAFCGLAIPAIAIAQTPPISQTRTAAVQHVRKVQQAQPMAPLAAPFGVLRQDLFDRNDPNNLRSDWPGPPAQPGQY